MKRKGKYIIAAMLLICVVLSGCRDGRGYKDGYYTAQMADYNHGYKEYVCILIKNNHIISVEFNAKDYSGYIKSWDNGYMNRMKSAQGTYPNEYTRKYAAQLVESQDIEKVDAVTGASNSGNNFVRLVRAALENAAKGNQEVAVVEEK